MIKKLAFLTASAAALGACATLHARGPLPDELKGVWASNGYGYVVAYDGKRPQLFQLSGKICQPMPPGQGGPFGFFDTFIADADGSRVEVRNSAQKHSFQLIRRSGIPAACKTPPKNTSTGNFEAFAAYMQSHYGFFDLYGVNWSDRVAVARKKVTDQTPDAELFSIFETMLAGINDAHLKLAGKTSSGKRSFSGNRGRTEGGITRTAISNGEDPRLARRMWNRHIWENSMNERLLGGRSVSHKSDFIQYGMADDGIGYISFFTMGGYSGTKSLNPIKDMKMAHRFVDQAIGYFQKNGAKAVIIDNSINHGGFDIVARAIASHFTNEPALAYSKAPLDASAPYRSDIFIKPAKGKRFTGPVYLLTSDVTVSAGEVMTLVLRAQPNVVHAGEKTRGALSDSLSKYLPNGWELSLSNEEYRDHLGRVWEGTGIQPDLDISVFGSGNIKNGHFEAVMALIAKIKQDLAASMRI